MLNWLSTAKKLPQKLNPRWQIIRAKILRDPYYRLQSAEEIQVAAELGMQIDVNQASVDDWLRLPGISIHQARSLVELVGMGVPLLCLEDLAAAIGIPVTRLKPLESLLDFAYYDPESLAFIQPVNPNIATVEQLAQIAVIDLVIAKKMVENRDNFGSYRNLADLQRRLGLDNELISQLMYYLRF